MLDRAEIRQPAADRPEPLLDDVDRWVSVEFQPHLGQLLLEIEDGRAHSVLLAFGRLLCAGSLLPAETLGSQKRGGRSCRQANGIAPRIAAVRRRPAGPNQGRSSRNVRQVRWILRHPPGPIVPNPFCHNHSKNPARFPPPPQTMGDGSAEWTCPLFIVREQGKEFPVTVNALRSPANLRRAGSETGTC